LTISGYLILITDKVVVIDTSQFHSAYDKDALSFQKTIQWLPMCVFYDTLCTNQRIFNNNNI